jgi:Ca2+-binding EF-hand superfamily protein
LFAPLAEQECKYADFSRARASGSLVMGKFNAKVSACTGAVPHTFRADGSLRYGDAVVIAHKQTGGSLACDPFTATGFEGNEFAASVCSVTESMARNTFIIGKVDNSDDNDEVRWGVPFRLLCNPSLRVDSRTGLLQPPLYLASALKNERKASPQSNQQLVFLTSKASYNTVFVAQAPAADKKAGASRLLQEGQSILAGSEMVIQHCGTKQLLASDVKYATGTDFGTEYEVCGTTVSSKGRISVLAGEFSGNTTAQTYAKPEQEQNVWAFCLSEDESCGVDSRDLPPMLTGAALLGKVLDVLRQRSRNAVRALKSAFRAMDTAGDGKLDREDLKWGLRDLGVDLDDEQFGILFDSFDAGGDGYISLSEFLVAVRGEMSDARIDIVLQAYEKLDADGSGMVTVDDILDLYDVESDPMVLEGVKTASEAGKEFMSMWETTPDGIVTRHEFIEYYKDLSAEVDSDDEFVQIVAAAWKL